jgi:preprotein translocase subunit SecE
MPNKLIQYLQDSKVELKKVAWPSKKQTINHTWLVIGFSVGMAIFLGILDYIFNLGLAQLIK